MNNNESPTNGDGFLDFLTARQQNELQKRLGATVRLSGWLGGLAVLGMVVSAVHFGEPVPLVKVWLALILMALPFLVLLSHVLHLSEK